MSTGTSNVSSLGGNQTNGNPQQPRNLQTLSSPALNPNHSTEKSIFQQPKNRPATTGQSLMETSAVKLQAETSTSDVSAGSAKPQTPVAGGIFKSLPATKPFPGIQKENASISRPFEQSSTPNFQMNPFTFGQVPAKGGFSMLPGRPFSNASTTQFTTFAAPVPRDNDVHRISAAADPSTGRSIGQNDVAKTPAASPLNLMVGNPDSACPTSERRTHPTKTKEDIVLSPRLASQTASTGITYDEEGVVCQEVQGTHSQQVERLSARLADDLRPMLHEYVRDKLTATNRDAATHMQRRTRNLLGLQSNAHFGFSILRDVEVKTMERMTREASALIEVVLAQISDPAKNVTSQGFKRETEVVEEASTEGDRPAKRARTRKA
ncbi:hypothetical protein LY76DRAFT_595877 [Colletotrichum caudatum]|nr:hypothetical protein LY76DRAFT_595877 [Colletotrichum caudatum]